MSYLPVVSRLIGDTSEGFEYAGVDEDGKTVTEVWDNEIIGSFSANGIEIHNDKKIGYVETSLSDINIDVYVTSSRILVRCDKYDKGSRHWRGGLSALALNAIEKGIGKARSKGKVLVGHMRYEWIVRILYQNKYSFVYVDNMVSVDYIDSEEKRSMRLILKFKKDVDTKALANLILSKACAYRLSMNDEKDEKEKEFFKKYSLPENTIPVSDEKGVYPYITFPTYIDAPYGSEYRPLSCSSGITAELSQAAEPLPENVSDNTPEEIVEDKITDKTSPQDDMDFHAEYDEDVTMLKVPDIELVYVKKIEAEQEDDDEKTVLLENISDSVTFKLVSISKDIVIEPDKDTFTLGRSQTKADYHIDNRAVSGVHARITVSEGKVQVQDLESSNHTFVNGTKIEPSVNKELKNGDILKLADEEFRVEIIYPTPAAAPPEPEKGGYFTLEFSEKGEKVDIRKTSFTLGRSKADADVAVSDDKTVGRIHAKIRVDPESGKIYVKDEDSANGTFLNDVRLDNGEEREINGGDRIAMSDVILRFNTDQYI